MKIELKYDGKNYYDPLFDLLYNNEKDNFGIAIRYNTNRDFDFIRVDLLNNFQKHEIKGTSFYYYTKENVYVFDLDKGFNLIPKNKNFAHCVVLCDTNHKVIDNTYHGFESTLYGNNN